MHLTEGGVGFPFRVSQSGVWPLVVSTLPLAQSEQQLRNLFPVVSLEHPGCLHSSSIGEVSIREGLPCSALRAAWKSVSQPWIICVMPPTQGKRTGVPAIANSLVARVTKLSMMYEQSRTKLVLQWLRNYVRIGCIHSKHTYNSLHKRPKHAAR